MSLDQKNQLFRLINTMTKHEKGYFKKYCSFHTVGTVNNYVLLFDAISEQEVYDERKIKQLLSKTIAVRNFREVKNYLFEMILKSLSAYHASTTTKLQLKKSIHSVEILYNKGLYDICKKMLDKVESKALQFNEYEILLEVSEWRSKIMYVNRFERVDESDVNKIHENEVNLLKKINKTCRYRHLHLLSAFKKGKNVYLRNKADIKKTYLSIIKDPLILNEWEAETTLEKNCLFTILGAYHFIDGNFELSLDYYSKQLSILEADSKINETKLSGYLSALHNVTVLSMRLNKYDNANKLINKMEQIKTKTPNFEIQKTILINTTKLTLFIHSAQFEKAEEYIPIINTTIKRFERKISTAQLYSFNYNIAVVYLVLNHYKKATSYLNQIINNPLPNVGNDIQSFARILNLIIHYEMKNWEYLNSVIPSTYRFLHKQKRLFEFENIVISFIKALKNIVNITETTRLFQSFYNEISTLKEDSYEKRVFDYFDFLSWAESKIQNRPMIEVLKKKV